jgi:hypothetical protein
MLRSVVKRGPFGWRRTVNSLREAQARRNKVPPDAFLAWGYEGNMRRDPRIINSPRRHRLRDARPGGIGKHRV